MTELEKLKDDRKRLQALYQRAAALLARALAGEEISDEEKDAYYADRDLTQASLHSNSN